MVSATCQPSDRTQSATLSMASLCASGSRTIPPLPTCPAPRLKLRLDQHHGLGKRGSGSQHRPQQQRGRDKRHIHHQQRQFRLPALVDRQCTRRKQAGVGALQQPDARVVAQLHGDLPKAGIDGGDMRRAVLQQAVGKPARRSAHIQAVAAGDESASAPAPPPASTRRGSRKAGHRPACEWARRRDTVTPGFSTFCSRTSTRPARIIARARSRLGASPAPQEKVHARLGAACRHDPCFLYSRGVPGLDRLTGRL
jgi:hypothetical protein